MPLHADDVAALVRDRVVAVHHGVRVAGFGVHHVIECALALVARGQHAGPFETYRLDRLVCRTGLDGRRRVLLADQVESLADAEDRHSDVHRVEQVVCIDVVEVVIAAAQHHVGVFRQRGARKLLVSDVVHEHDHDLGGHLLQAPHELAQVGLLLEHPHEVVTGRGARCADAPAPRGDVLRVAFAARLLLLGFVVVAADQQNCWDWCHCLLYVTNLLAMH